jgi:hypothetical protein
MEKANHGILNSLNNLWRGKNRLSLNMKKQFNVATIINSLLWGCESITLLLQQHEPQKLVKSVHHPSSTMIKVSATCSTSASGGKQLPKNCDQKET